MYERLKELPGRVTQMDMETQNRYFTSRYQIFCKRDERHIENQRTERLAERVK